jgi:hypothetical protein
MIFLIAYAASVNSSGNIPMESVELVELELRLIRNKGTRQEPVEDEYIPVASGRRFSASILMAAILIAAIAAGQQHAR